MTIRARGALTTFACVMAVMVPTAAGAATTTTGAPTTTSTTAGTSTTAPTTTAPASATTTAPQAKAVATTTTTAAPNKVAASPEASAVTPAAVAGSPRTFIVNSVADRGDARRNGVCATSIASECTLRAAIQEADAANGPSTIAFNIGGTGVHTINLASELPPLNNNSYGITIDGYTQPGSAPNTDGVEDRGVRTIEVAGKGPTGFEGFVINTAHHTIRGMSIHGFRRAIVMRQATSNFTTIVGNIVGLTPSGDYDPHHQYVAGSSCIQISGGAHDNVVGAPGNANRNTIGGCSHHGVATYNYPTRDNKIQNNIIGLDGTGTQDRGDQGYAVDINTGTQYTLVGGANPGERNVASGNIGNGIEISHEKLTMFNVVYGNYIGTNLTATAVNGITANGAAGMHFEGKGNCAGQPCPPDANHNSAIANVIAGNHGPGVQIDKGSNNDLVARNLIGVLPSGTSAPNGVGVLIESGAFSNTIGPANFIVNNDTAIQVQPTMQGHSNYPAQATNFNRFTQNSIYYTPNPLAIDLFPYGYANTNVGAANTNEGVRNPTISTADRTSVVVRTCANCTVELFLSQRGAGLAGQGRQYLATAKASAAGIATFSTPSPLFGHTATVNTTTPDGSTSEFSVGAWVR